MQVRIEIAPKPDAIDARGAALCAQIQHVAPEVRGVEVRDVYFLGGELSPADVDLIRDKLLLDPVDQRVAADGPGLRIEAGLRIEVAPLPGVTDTVGENLLRAAKGLGIHGLRAAGAGRAYLVQGEIAPAQAQRIAEAYFGNPVVDAIAVDGSVQAPFAHGTPTDLRVETVPVTGLDDAALLALSKDRRLSLDLTEMRAVQAHFERLGRAPRDAELEMLAQTWSEHCVHKTFKARIDFEMDGRTEIIDGLFGTYIKAATDALDSDWLHSVFVDNAGIVGFDDDWDLAFKVETHNHPSALDPFGGSNTGVGGVIRDILGVSARPIAVTDVLCFGPQDLPQDALPDGLLHPRQIADGVIAGVADYGNKMGIPTVDGAVLYDPGYIANPLVYCGCLGILPRDGHPTTPQVGDRVIAIGGRTGRDGLRGATFSSMEMDTETAGVASTAVQIGHPINEKQAMEVVIEARDQGLYHAITDCGAGGFSSAVGEMAEALGAQIDLAGVPLKYAGLRPWEIWLSEAQERMVLAVPPAHLDALAAVCERHGVEWADLGFFTGDRRMVVRHGDVMVVDLDCQFLHDGIPQRQMQAVWRPVPQTPFSADFDLHADLLALLATPDIRSKEDIVRRYDHEVQGGTVVKPFAGPTQQGPSDAAVLRPFEAAGASHRKGVALSVGINPGYGEVDPYAMAWAAVDEAIRNAVAVGADPAQVAILDNFSWGNPRRPETLGALVRACQGCYDAALTYGAPFISGKDSLNNEYLTADGTRRAIPPTLLVSALAIVPDIDCCVTMDFKAEGETIFLVGEPREELGASAWSKRRGITGGIVPQPNRDAPHTYRALHAAMQAGLVTACHDVSDGGLAVALAEMALASGIGADVRVANDPPVSVLARLFGESSGCLVVTVAAEADDLFYDTMNGACTWLGQTGGQTLKIGTLYGMQPAAPSAEWTLGALQTAFCGHLR
jgi:phosphoribosylformylglycinamidine synthase